MLALSSVGPERTYRGYREALVLGNRVRVQHLRVFAYYSFAVQKLGSKTTSQLGHYVC